MPGYCSTSALVASSAAILFIVVWALFINHLVTNAHITEGLDHWVNMARDEAYGVCYDGCNDCLDVESIAAACQMTRKVNISGVVCDASKMWTWADRYPLECLISVGEIYRSDALWWKRFWLRSLYILSLAAWPIFLVMYSATEKLSKLRTVERRRGIGIRTPLLNAATISILALVSVVPSVGAYRCTYMNPAHNQHFASADGTLYGVIHGWLSDCYDQSSSCGESCSTPSSSGKETCSPIWCSQPQINQPPRYFVNAAARRIRECGFRMVDAIPGIVDKRIANPRIEGTLWVKVSVNQFNGTGGLLEQVRCLYDIV